MGVFTFPSSKVLTTIEQKIRPSLTKDNPIFSIFPERSLDSHLLEWEQKDNFVGMMSPRGLDGAPPRVKQVGFKSYSMRPGVYGEYMAVTEFQGTAARQFGTLADPIDVSELVVDFGQQLLYRQLTRQAWIGWQALLYGYFTVTGPTGAILHQDAWTQRTSTASDWSAPTTATPLADMRAVQLLARGYSMDLGASSVMYMNRTTANYFLANTNAADLGGKKGMGLSSITSINGVNEILTGEGLPNIVIWDGGYQDDTDTFTLDIPTDKVIVLGRRHSGVSIGGWINTRNMNNPGFAPGAYYKVRDRSDEVPPTVEVHRGTNGGLAIEFPSAIIVMNV